VGQVTITKKIKLYQLQKKVFYFFRQKKVTNYLLRKIL